MRKTTFHRPTRIAIMSPPSSFSKIEWCEIVLLIMPPPETLYCAITLALPPRPRQIQFSHADHFASSISLGRQVSSRTGC
jgi:hypothetical protein